MRRVLMMLASVAGLGAATAADATAVILSFDTNEMACTGVDGGAVDRACTTNSQLIGGNYGSTAELAVSYDASESTGSRTSLAFNLGNGGRAALIGPGPATEPSLIFFTPIAGYEVSFSNFTWSKTSATTSADFYFEVVDPMGVLLYEGGDAPVSHVVNTAYFAGPLTFRFSNGGRGGVAIDRIAVDVKATAAPPPPPPPPGVPEPATWAMMLIGFGATGAVMRRRVRTARA